MGRDPRFWQGIVLPTVLMLLGSLALVVAWSGRLPAEVAQQWNWTTGNVSTVGPLWLTVLLQAALAAATLLVLIFMKWSGKLTGSGRRLSIAVLAAVSVFLAASLPAMLAGQVGLSDPSEAPDPRSLMALVAVFSLVYGVLAALVAGPRPASARAARLSAPW